MNRVSVSVDGTTYEDEVETRLLLVHLLRDRLNLTGTPIGCETGNCGACTVDLDGMSVKSCLVLAVQADGCEVKTVQGLARDGELHPLQRSFHEQHALQCGYCTPGMIMAARDLLQRNRNPSPQVIRQALVGNLCRCTGYQNIVKAVLAAASDLEAATSGDEAGHDHHAVVTPTSPPGNGYVTDQGAVER
ncbi:(2Fe-2S)-binding protein [Streptomyces sp. NPDC059802]|uniref:(2Fe-2S)-binding protein n=1 Tax=Streptomyces sp. NPDC059802 TaxID=3346952 RepID=UPI00365F353A